MGSARAFDFVVLAIGVIAVSTAAILIREADAPSLVIAAYRLVLATVPMLAFTAFKGGGLLPRKGEHAFLVLVAGLSLALHFAFWIESVKQTSIVTSVVLVTTAPLFVAVASGPLLGERPARAVWYGLAMTLVGMLIMVADDFGEGGDTLRGDLYALFGAGFTTVFLLAGRRALGTGGSWLPYSTATYAIAAAVLVLMVVVAGDPFTGYGMRTYAFLVFLALVPQIVGHTALNRSLGVLPAFAVALAVQGEPVASTVLAALVLDEFPTPFQLVGGVLVLFGVYLGLRPSMRRDRTPATG